MYSAERKIFEVENLFAEKVRFVAFYVRSVNLAFGLKPNYVKPCVFSKAFSDFVVVV